MHRAKGTATIRASRQPGGAAASAAACLHRIEVQDVAVGILQPDPLRAAGDMDVAFEAPEPAPARGRRRRARGQGRSPRRWRRNLILQHGGGPYRLSLPRTAPPGKSPLWPLPSKIDASRWSEEGSGGKRGDNTGSNLVWST